MSMLIIAGMMFLAGILIIVAGEWRTRHERMPFVNPFIGIMLLSASIVFALIGLSLGVF